MTICNVVYVINVQKQTEVLNSIASALISALKPKEVMEQLNKFIIGQADAKRAVAVALRNRWRRHQLGEDIKNEVNFHRQIRRFAFTLTEFRSFPRTF